MWIHIWKLPPLFYTLWYFSFPRDHSAHAEIGEAIISAPRPSNHADLELSVWQVWTPWKCLVTKAWEVSGCREGMVWSFCHLCVAMVCPLFIPVQKSSPCQSPGMSHTVWIHSQNQGWENFYTNSMLVKKKLKPNPKPKQTPYTSLF